MSWDETLYEEEAKTEDISVHLSTAVIYETGPFNVGVPRDGGEEIVIEAPDFKVTFWTDSEEEEWTIDYNYTELEDEELRKKLESILYEYWSAKLKDFAEAIQAEFYAKNDNYLPL